MKKESRGLCVTCEPGSRVSAARTRSRYDHEVDPSDPTVLWRLFHPQGRHARAVLLPGTPRVTLTFFVDDVMDRAENYDTMDLALFRANDIKRSLVGEGWQEDE